MKKRMPFPEKGETETGGLGHYTPEAEAPAPPQVGVSVMGPSLIQDGRAIFSNALRDSSRAAPTSDKEETSSETISSSDLSSSSSSDEESFSDPAFEGQIDATQFVPIPILAPREYEYHQPPVSPKPSAPPPKKIDYANDKAFQLAQQAMINARSVPSDGIPKDMPDMSEQRLRRGNRRESIDDTKGYSFAAVQKMRQVFNDFVAKYKIVDEAFLIELKALAAQIFRAGNCGELAARTFQALTQNGPEYTVLSCALARFPYGYGGSDIPFLDLYARDHAFTILYPGPETDIVKETTILKGREKTTVHVLKRDSIEHENIYVVDAWMSEDPMPLSMYLSKYNESEFESWGGLDPDEIYVSFSNSRQSSAASTLTEEEKVARKEEFKALCSEAAHALQSDSNRLEEARQQSKTVNGIYKFSPWKLDDNDRDSDNEEV